MEKQLVIVSLVTLLVGVGLSGCDKKSEKSGDRDQNSVYITVSELQDHPDRYFGQQVTVMGYLSTSVRVPYGTDWEYELFYIVEYTEYELQNNPMIYGYLYRNTITADSSTLIAGGHYDWTGTVTQENNNNLRLTILDT